MIIKLPLQTINTYNNYIHRWICRNRDPSLSTYKYNLQLYILKLYQEFVLETGPETQKI